MSRSEVVLVAVDDGVATITLNRPDARNAMNSALGVGLARAVADCEADDGVAAMILTGADPAFCAGADLEEISNAPTGVPVPDPDDPYRRDEIGKYAEFRGPFPPHDKPLIGAINGACITGGFEIALNCDFLIASERARFADTHARVGIMPGWGLTVLLVESVGVRRARELSATGNFIDASTALAWGLVNHVVPHEDLLPFTRDLARAVVGNDQVAVQRMFATYAEIAASVYDDGWAIEDRVNRAWLADGIDAAEVGRRRSAIEERGRTQL
ncbi:MAG TPA: enoyl-CoA hydratase [Acidimicrobiia bacterium]|nr:enoyl-CoA hydratase [Acidimicrobiia bacterium]